MTRQAYRAAIKGDDCWWNMFGKWIVEVAQEYRKRTRRDLPKWQWIDHFGRGETPREAVNQCLCG